VGGTIYATSSRFPHFFVPCHVTCLTIKALSAAASTLSTMTTTIQAQDLVHGLLSTLTGKLIALAAVVGAATTVWGGLRPLLRATGRQLGRHWRLRRQLRQLACDVQIDHFQHLLGQPAQYVNRADSSDEIEHVYVFDDAYVQAVTDQHGKVDYFSVTSRTRRFRPKLNYHPGGPSQLATVKLGSTRFAQLGDTPTEVHAWLGARWFGYVESYYFGNPGNYQTYVFAFNDAGAGEAAAGYLANLFPPRSAGEIQLRRFSGLAETDDLAEWLRGEGARGFRDGSAINTYAVVSARSRVGLLVDEGEWKRAFGFGPDYDQVRTSPADSRIHRRLWSRH
jgi:hypothetical protein